MITNEETLELALEAFWAKVAELHPERETRVQDPGATYDLENYARNAVSSWLKINKPVFYVQRTAVHVIRVVGAATPEEAEEIGASYDDPEWSGESFGTSYKYLVLDQRRKCC